MIILLLFTPLKRPKIVFLRLQKHRFYHPKPMLSEAKSYAFAPPKLSF